jgi:molecular chaperone GrpE
MIDRQTFANQLFDYLQTVPESPDYLAAAPENLEAFDPYQMVAEWIALRQEVKQQNKLLQTSHQALQQALEVERSRNDQLQAQMNAQPTTPTAPKTESEGGLIKDLLTIMDALDQAIAHSNNQLATIAATPNPPSNLLTQFLPFLKTSLNPPQNNTLTDALTSNQAGIAMIRRSLLEILQKRQIRPIEAVGQPFDSQSMYAIAQQPSDTVPTNIVIQEVVRGYWQGDRILREAQVIVAS